MYVQHSEDIWRDYPDLVPGVVAADGIRNDVAVTSRVAAFTGTARDRLASGSEGQFPEIQAWRRTFAKMGLKPTQYRCASESLLRRLRKDGALPPIHPMIDLCNAISLAFAIPIAVFDADRIAEGVEVRHASGSERYVTFSGETEHPEPGEVIFADAAGQAHARRWTNRQSGNSAIRDTTTNVLIVAEAMHDSAPADIERLVTTIAEELSAVWTTTPKTGILTASSPRFES